MISQRSSLVDVCYAVCTALDAVGTKAVLVGGSAATFYVPERYQSHDADFIIRFGGDKRAHNALLALGFAEDGAIYRHPQSPYTLEFPAGPAGIGNRVLSDFATFRRNHEILYVVSAADSVCDRLAKYYYWDDTEAFRTAADIAIACDVDLDYVRTWSHEEGETAQFEEFERYLKQLHRR